MQARRASREELEEETRFEGEELERDFDSFF